MNREKEIERIKNDIVEIEKQIEDKRISIRLQEESREADAHRREEEGKEPWTNRSLTDILNRLKGDITDLNLRKDNKLALLLTFDVEELASETTILARKVRTLTVLITILTVVTLFMAIRTAYPSLNARVVSVWRSFAYSMTSNF